MIILDIPQGFDGATIHLPLYHRGHLSLFPGSTVWTCLLPGSPARRTLPEIIVSPIGFGSWSKLYRITGTFVDRSGLVHDVLETLRTFGINVLTAESSAIAQQQHHTVELVVDSSTHQHPASPRSQEDTLPEVRKALLAQLFDDLVFSEVSDLPRLKIRPVRTLQQAVQDFDRALSDHRRGGLMPIVAESTVQRAPNSRRVSIELSEEQREVLRVALDPNGRAELQSARYLAVSETTDRFLRAYFISGAQPILAARITHRERVGALAAITRALQRAGFNLITSLSRLHRHLDTAEFEVVLQPVPGARWNPIDTRERLESALAGPELHLLQLRVSYPAHYGDPAEPIPIATAKHVAFPGQDLRGDRKESPRTTEGILQTKLRQLNEVRNPTANEERRRKLAESLLGAQSPGLFLSYAFELDDVVTGMQRFAARLRFRPITGRHLGIGKNREQVLREIRKCSFFFGVWSAEGGIPLGNGRFWPSPWMHWELGAAHALGLHCHLLIEDTIHPAAWELIVPDMQNTVFRREELYDLGRDLLRTLSRVAAQARASAAASHV
jgi:predicted amino acid-binding ACT domain protein